MAQFDAHQKAHQMQVQLAGRLQSLDLEQAWKIMENHGKIMENHGNNNYGIFLPFYGEIIFK